MLNRAKGLIVDGLFLLAAITAIYAFPGEQSLSVNSEFGQSQPCTEPERELNQMLRGKVNGIDLALANWLVAADIPEFRDMTREACFTQLDAMTEQVRRVVKRLEATQDRSLA